MSIEKVKVANWDEAAKQMVHAIIHLHPGAEVFMKDRMEGEGYNIFAPAPQNQVMDIVISNGRTLPFTARHERRASKVRRYG